MWIWPCRQKWIPPPPSNPFSFLPIFFIFPWAVLAPLPGFHAQKAAKSGTKGLLHLDQSSPSQPATPMFSDSRHLNSGSNTC